MHLANALGPIFLVLAMPGTMAHLINNTAAHAAPTEPGRSDARRTGRKRAEDSMRGWPHDFDGPGDNSTPQPKKSAGVYSCKQYDISEGLETSLRENQLWVASMWHCLIEASRPPELWPAPLPGDQSWEEWDKPPDADEQPYPGDGYDRSSWQTRRCTAAAVVGGRSNPLWAKGWSLEASSLHDHPPKGHPIARPWVRPNECWRGCMQCFASALSAGAAGVRCEQRSDNQFCSAGWIETVREGKPPGYYPPDYVPPHVV